jgi:hypothetical protein
LGAADNVDADIVQEEGRDIAGGFGVADLSSGDDGASKVAVESAGIETSSSHGDSGTAVQTDCGWVNRGDISTRGSGSRRRSGRSSSGGVANNVSNRGPLQTLIGIGFSGTLNKGVSTGSVEIAETVEVVAGSVNSN